MNGDAAMADVRDAGGDAPVQPLVAIRGLSKHYVRGEQVIPVLVDIDLDIAAGEYIALMGPSGSGKSTLLNLIAGIDKPSAGEIRVAGVDIARLDDTDLAAWRAAHVGFIFQFYNLMPVLTAFENVELPLLLTSLSRRERRQRVETALALVGLSDRSDHYPNELSGGQQQRVAIARALISDPTLIVADEPTGDLDRTTAEEILGLLDRLNRELGKTIIMVTHDPKAAARRTAWCTWKRACSPTEPRHAAARLRAASGRRAARYGLPGFGGVGRASRGVQHVAVELELEIERHRQLARGRAAVAAAAGAAARRRPRRARRAAAALGVDGAAARRAGAGTGCPRRRAARIRCAGRRDCRAAAGRAARGIPAVPHDDTSCRTMCGNASSAAIGLVVRAGSCPSRGVCRVEPQVEFLRELAEILVASLLAVEIEQHQPRGGQRAARAADVLLQDLDRAIRPG